MSSKESRRSIKSSQIRMRTIELGIKAATSGIDFVDADVTVATDLINYDGHGFVTGDRLQLTTTGVLPAGLALTTDYWVIKYDVNNFGLASSLANAIAGTYVNITGAAGGGTHTATLTEVLTGAARLRAHKVQVQSTGVYRIIWDVADPFASADDYTVVCTTKSADTILQISAQTATYVEITVKDADTPAVEDGFFSLLAIGSESSSRW